MGPNGDLYGVTAQGGPGGDGTIFKITGDTHALITLATFNGANGETPVSLIRDAAGNLFGTTENLGIGAPGGTIFERTAGSSEISTLATLPAGYSELGSLLPDANGNLYGTTYLGGPRDDGSIFELTDSGYAVPEPSVPRLGGAVSIAALVRRRRSISPHL